MARARRSATKELRAKITELETERNNLSEKLRSFDTLVDAIATILEDQMRSTIESVVEEKLDDAHISY